MLTTATLVCGLLLLMDQAQAEKVFEVEEMEKFDSDQVLQSIASLHDIASTDAVAKELALILALAKDKEETEFAGRKVQDLVDLNKLDVSACLMSELKKRQAICEIQPGASDSLEQYCRICIQALMDFCAQRPVGKLVDRYLKGRVNAIRNILEASAEIVRYIEEKKGLDQEPEDIRDDELYLDEGLIEEFFSNHPSESDEFALASVGQHCQEILDGMKLELSHLIDEKSAILYLDTKYSGGTLAMLQCKIIANRFLIE